MNDALDMGRFRIGIDTGGTFTDIVAVDRASGAVSATKVPSTPDNPARALVQGVAAISDIVGAEPADVAALCHGTTVATNAMLEDRFGALGLIVTAGFRHVLEIARQSVPEGYGNSYFWVKPDRIVPLSLVREVAERLDHRGAVVRPLDEASVREAARFFARKKVRSIGVCLLHAYANPAHEARVRDILSDEIGGVFVSVSHEVLPEYREYERTVTTLVDAFVKPHMNKYLADIHALLEPAHKERPFVVMKSNGGIAGVEQIRAKPIVTALSGPAAGALGAATVADKAGFKMVVTLDAGGTSTDLCLVEDGRPHLTTTGSIGRYPVKLPMIDIVTIGTGGGSIAWRNPEGRLAVGPKSAGAAPGPMCYPNGGDAPTLTDAYLVLGRIPPALIGGAIALDAERAREGMRRLGEELGLDAEPAAVASGIVEVANWNQANAIRQLIVRRGVAAGELALMSFGGSGPVQSAAVMDLVGLDATIVPPDPGNVSAFGLLAGDWRTDHVVTRVMFESAIDRDRLAGEFARLEDEAKEALLRDGVAVERTRLERYIDVRYEGQADELRIDVPGGAVDEAFVGAVLDAFHQAHERYYGYAYRGEQPVEIVNLAVSGFGAVERPKRATLDRSGDAARALKGRRQVYFETMDGFQETPIYERRRLRGGAHLDGPAVIEEFGSTTVIFPGQAATVDDHGTLIIRARERQGGDALATSKAAAVDPITVQIVKESLDSIEREVEAAIERTSRSPMIRDQHDYRVGLHDCRCRKLTGRSYSAMVNPVVRDFPLASMKPGDVYFFNDVYLSEGSIGHLPDLCSTVPVFHAGEVVAFVQAFGHHDDIGGSVPGSMPGNATSCFEEGLMIPPIKLVHRGVRNEAAFAIIKRNTRLPDSLAADIDSEVAACVMGAKRLEGLFERFGRETMEACFQTVLDQCRDVFQNELLPRIPDGAYEFEDFVEHDGVSEPRLHKLALKMTKTADKIVLDFNGVDPQAAGPINWPADYADGRFLIKWIAPVLRNLAESPERAAQIDVNEGVCEVFEIKFPPKGTLMTPVFPAPTNARSFVLLRCIGLLAGAVAKAVGGAMPADQETIRYSGLYGDDEQGRFFLWREVLGGGSGGRHYADGSDVIHIVPDSRNQPAEFVETRFPIRVERLALRTDSGGPGRRRGGLGYEKDIVPLCDAHAILTADRVRLGCYGVNGGRAGLPFRAVVDPEGRRLELDGLVNGADTRKGRVFRIQTTGGGGWGDPLDREPDLVRDDLLEGRVSEQGARADYGVSVSWDENCEPIVDAAATAKLRAELRERRAEAPDLIDRGPGYERLKNSRGRLNG